MMKKMTAFFLALALCLVGVGAWAQGEAVQVEQAGQAPRVISRSDLGGVEVEVWRYDYSLMLRGAATVYLYFDLPVIRNGSGDAYLYYGTGAEGQNESVYRINRSLWNVLGDYVESRPWDAAVDLLGENEFLQMGDEFFNGYSLGGWGYAAPLEENFDHTAEYCDGKIISFLFCLDWYMGGVGTNDAFGHTYDLETGEELSLHDLLGGDGEALNEQLKDVVRREMHELMGEGDFYQDMETTLENYRMEDYRYFVSGDGEIVLCFQRYELGPGALGSPMVPTGMYVDGTEAVGE